MTFSFDAHEGLIIVRAEISSPTHSAIVRLGLDTGATSTLVNAGVLVAIGYDPATVPERVQITTGSAVEFVPRISLNRMVALGQERAPFPVLCHTLPPSAAIDGLLGLDFLRGQTLEIDFQRGLVELISGNL